MEPASAAPRHQRCAAAGRRSEDGSPTVNQVPTASAMTTTAKNCHTRAGLAYAAAICPPCSCGGTLGTVVPVRVAAWAGGSCATIGQSRSVAASPADARELRQTPRKTSFVPHVEEIAEVGIWHSVVVRGIGYDRINRLGCARNARCRSTTDFANEVNTRKITNVLQDPIQC